MSMGCKFFSKHEYWMKKSSISATYSPARCFEEELLLFTDVWDLWTAWAVGTCRNKTKKKKKKTLILSPPPPDCFIVVCSSLRNYSKPPSFLLCGKLSNWGPHIDEPSAGDARSLARSLRRFVSKQPDITLSFREVIKGRHRARSHRLIVFVQNVTEYPVGCIQLLTSSQVGDGRWGGGGAGG